MARRPPVVCRLATFTDLSRIAPPPWNELVVDGRANVYVNNTGFDFPGAEFAPGSIVLITPDGSARRAAGDVAFPNGMVVTPDNRTLILAESYASRLTAFEIAPDGSLGDRRVWAELDGGAPDGICLDTDGAVWYADVPNKRCVRVREGGKVLQTVAIDRGCFACMLGGSDNSTLFIVAAQWSDTRRRRRRRRGHCCAGGKAAPTTACAVAPYGGANASMMSPSPRTKTPRRLENSRKPSRP
jgi:sugar lactone lactonase YvrE